MKHKLLVGAAGVALLFASAMTFHFFTGDCPLRCLFEVIHGQPATGPG